MTTATLLRLSWRLTYRNWKSGDLRLIAFALILAMTVSTSIGLFVDRLEAGMRAQAFDLLGAQLILSSPRPVDDAWLQQAKAQNLAFAEVIEFTSMAATDEAFLLSSVKVASPPYPLKGELRVAPKPFAEDQATRQLPEPGSAWVENRVLSGLNVEVGDSIQLGRMQLTVSRVLTYEPDKAGGFYSLSPRILMHRADLEKADLIQPGSRVSYRYLFTGDEQAIADYRDHLQPQLTPSHDLISAEDGSPMIRSSMSRAKQYLFLAAVLALLLSGVAIALAVRHHSERLFDTSALLRCFGCSHRQMLVIVMGQFLLLWLAAAALALLVAMGLQQLLIVLLKELLPSVMPPARPATYLLSPLVGLLTLLGFSFPNILRVARVPPLRVLRKDLQPKPVATTLAIGFVLATTLMIIYYATGSVRMSALIFVGGGATVVVFLALAWLLLKSLGPLMHNGRPTLRWSYRNLSRQPSFTAAQVVGFGITLTAMGLVALMRTDLLDTWQRQLPANTPNHFALNIQPGEVEALKSFFDQRGIQREHIYPMVRGRLTHLNGERLTRAVTKERNAEGELDRELNLTWAAHLQSDNAIIDGHWWLPGDNGQQKVSVESELAEQMGIEVGDSLRFLIGSRELQAQVASLRSVQWDSFKPNFYMIFPPDTLNGLPATYLTSFYLPEDRKSVLNQLVKQFPSVSILEMDKLLNQAKAMMTQVILAVEAILVFVLLAGIAILWAAVLVTFQNRLHQGALFRTFGADRRTLRTTQWLEFGILGMLSTLLACATTEAVLALLYRWLLELPMRWHWELWLLCVPFGTLIITWAGAVSIRRVINQSPMSILRDVN